jgi:hypothetical protein
MNLSHAACPTDQDAPAREADVPDDGLVCFELAHRKRAPEWLPGPRGNATGRKPENDRDRKEGSGIGPCALFHKGWAGVKADSADAAARAEIEAAARRPDLHRSFRAPIPAAFEAGRYQNSDGNSAKSSQWPSPLPSPVRIGEPTQDSRDGVVSRAAVGDDVGPTIRRLKA